MKTLNKKIISISIVAIVVLVVIFGVYFFQLKLTTSENLINERQTIPNTSASTTQIQNTIGGKATIINDGFSYELSYGNTEYDQCLTLNKSSINDGKIISSSKICSITVDKPIIGIKRTYSFSDKDINLQDITFSDLNVDNKGFNLRINLYLVQGTRDYSCKLNDFEKRTVNCSRVWTLNDFGLKRGDSYIDVKRALLEDGWIPKISPVVTDKNFPEITGCGNGYDAVCSVFFTKGKDSFGFYINYPKGSAELKTFGDFD